MERGELPDVENRREINYQIPQQPPGESGFNPKEFNLSNTPVNHDKTNNISHTTPADPLDKMLD